MPVKVLLQMLPCLLQKSDESIVHKFGAQTKEVLVPIRIDPRLLFSIPLEAGPPSGVVCLECHVSISKSFPILPLLE